MGCCGRGFNQYDNQNDSGNNCHGGKGSGFMYVLVIAAFFLFIIKAAF